MQIVEGLGGLQILPHGSTVSIGNFDGLHRGHQSILEKARQLRAAGGGELVAVTFEPHPLTVLAPHRVPARLSPPALKRELLEQQGVDRLIILPPLPEVLELSAENFWSIIRSTHPRHLVEGGNFTFGKGRGGNIARLREWSQGSGIQLHEVSAVEVVLMDLTVAPVSSSLVRWLIANGRMRDAAVALGRPYALEGEVVKGYQRGRGIGFPTANIAADEQLAPLEGVYAGRCMINDNAYLTAVSVGRMETFGDQLRRQIEAHIIGFEGDLYGRHLRVEILDWVRGQVKFNSIDELVRQIKRDVERVREKGSIDVSRPIASVEVGA